MADSCPACGFASVDTERCPNCHVLVALHRSALEAMRRGPARPSAMPTAPRLPTPAQGGASAPAPTAGPPNAAASAPAPTAGAPNAWARNAASSTSGAPLGSLPGTTAPRPSVPRPAITDDLHWLRFHGTGGTLFGMHIVNVLLTMVTFGVYRFWAKARVRQFMMSQTELAGERFAWHGTGRELLIGFTKAVLIFFLPVACLNTLGALAGDESVRRLTGALGSLIVATFVPLAIVGVYRYRLSRTSYRGIRFSFNGRPWEFVKRFWRDSWLISFTFGLYYPVFQFRRQEFLISHSQFGQRHFKFSGNATALLSPFVISLLLTLPTLGLAWFWYAARKRRYFAECTSFGTAQFRSSVTGAELMGLVLTNAFLLLVSLGLAWPWVRVRTTNFNYARLRIEGQLDLDSIVQQRQDAPATGDALAGFLGADFNLG